MRSGVFMGSEELVNRVCAIYEEDKEEVENGEKS